MDDAIAPLIFFVIMVVFAVVKKVQEFVAESKARQEGPARSLTVEEEFEAGFGELDDEEDIPVARPRGQVEMPMAQPRRAQGAPPVIIQRTAGHPAQQAQRQAPPPVPQQKPAASRMHREARREAIPEQQTSARKMFEAVKEAVEVQLQTHAPAPQPARPQAPPPVRTRSRAELEEQQRLKRAKEQQRIAQQRQQQQSSLEPPLSKPSYFENTSDLRRAILLSEILGPPKALRNFRRSMRMREL